MRTAAPPGVHVTESLKRRPLPQTSTTVTADPFAAMSTATVPKRSMSLLLPGIISHRPARGVVSPAGEGRTFRSVRTQRSAAVRSGVMGISLESCSFHK